MFFTSSFPEMETEEEHATKKPKHDGGGGDDRKIVPFAVGGGDGSSIEVAKRPRGRPIGSKNKPKPPVIITRESDPPSAMRPHVLEISAGDDIVASLSRFSTRRNLGVCLLAATGGVSNVTLRQPPHPSAAVGSPGTVGFSGSFEILSISGTFLPAGMRVGLTGAVTVSLAGPGGQVLGGMVVGPVVASATVTVVAAVFDKLEFHRLPLPEDEAAAVAADVSVSGGSSRDRGASEGGYRHHRHHYQHQRETENDHDEVAVETMYSSHFPGELMWAPTVSRPPPY